MNKFSKLRNIYWQIRFSRNKSRKRKYYRYAADEKKRLLEAGVDKEELRLISVGSIPRPLGRKLVENQQIEERS